VTTGAGQGAGRLELRRPVFLSDVHLTTQRPASVTRLLAVLGGLALDASGPGELLVLGDFFEYWPGDDAIGEANAHPAPDDLLGGRVADALAALAGAGWRIFVMHGNRDLLLGEGFLRRARAQLLPDPTVAVLPGAVPVLLSHGDAWCTLDTAYQAFRAQARDPDFQQGFLALPLEVRRARIGQAREKSEAGKKLMESQIMDVTQAAVEEAMRAAGVLRVIHGHTHRPARHEFMIHRSPAVRWVLPDWHDEAGEPPRGGPMRWVDGGLVAA
jgi:UDP-2,3-diacylglucosamine hydrolase